MAYLGGVIDQDRTEHPVITERHKYITHNQTALLCTAVWKDMRDDLFTSVIAQKYDNTDIEIIFS